VQRSIRTFYEVVKKGTEGIKEYAGTDSGH
jgi:hypothetical protein